MDRTLESRLTIHDLEELQTTFTKDADGKDNNTIVNRDQFVEILSNVLQKGSPEEFGDLFDKIDLTKDENVDWNKFAAHMLQELTDQDDRTKSTVLLQWKDLKYLSAPHKEKIQGISYLKNNNRYLAVSREGCATLWSHELKLQTQLRLGTDSCKARDLWVTHFVVLQNINKVALSYTCKEIAIFDITNKMEFNCQYRIQGLKCTPLCMDFWSKPTNLNEAFLTWGDIEGNVHAIQFTMASIALFERPSDPTVDKQEPCLNVQLKDIKKRRYGNAFYIKHSEHEGWVRQVRYVGHLDCFLSCATTNQNSLVIGWREKSDEINGDLRTTSFQINQGVNAFDYHDQLNLIATAGVNHHVTLWNPYVLSKHNGVLRGHMASVLQVLFNKSRKQLISFSKDKILRIWDVQLQVCMQRLAGMFPKGPDVTTTLYFHGSKNNLFLTFNNQLTVLEIKKEDKDRTTSHEFPVVMVRYNATYNQVISISRDGTVTSWNVETGQKVKQFSKAHGDCEITAAFWDLDQTKFYTAGSDGLVKMWDINGHCYHILEMHKKNQPADIGSIFASDCGVFAVGWTKSITIFRPQNFTDYHVFPSTWKSKQEHSDDILSITFSPPNILATGAYDGEIIIWNTNSEQIITRINTRTNQESDMNNDGIHEAHTICKCVSSPMRLKSPPKLDILNHEETDSFGFAITQLILLEARASQNNFQGANLISCTGNGCIQFFNFQSGNLLMEFYFQNEFVSVTMCVSKCNNYLAIGDIDGYVKVWKITDVSLKAEKDCDESIHSKTIVHFQPHMNMITSIDLIKKCEQFLLVTASTDCSVQLWYINGTKIGIFGQENLWKITPSSLEQSEDDSDDKGEDLNTLQINKDEDSHWEPDDDAILHPEKFHLNVWNSTELGSDFKENRMKKQQRKQPDSPLKLPYLNSDKNYLIGVGPYSFLKTHELKPLKMLQKPDFVLNPHKYFSNRTDSPGKKENLHLAEKTLTTIFDEKSIFPKFILDFDAQLKEFHQATLKDQQKKAGFSFLKATGMLGQPRLQSGKKTGTKTLKLNKLKALKTSAN